MAAFKVGDTVQLKSGSPTMTVIRVDDKGWAWCQWFDGNKTEKGHFPLEALTAAK